MKYSRESKRGQYLHRVMTQFAEIPVHRMRPRQERQHGRAAYRQTIEANFQTLIVGSISQSAYQGIGRILSTVRGYVDLGEIQIELRLAPAHADGGTAEFLRLGPLLLCRRDGHSHIGNIERIGWFFFEGAFEMGQGPVRIASAQKREAGTKFLECLDLDHVHVLHWASPTSPPCTIPRRGPFLRRC